MIMDPLVNITILSLIGVAAIIIGIGLRRS